MKRFVLILISILFALSLFTACSSPQDILSEEEIEVLREEYPLYTNEPAMASRVPVSFRKYLTGASEVAYLEIKSDRMYYSYSLDGTMPSELEEKWENMGIANIAEFFEYEAVVLDATEGLLQKGDTITISCTKVMEDCTPEFESGNRIITLLAEPSQRNYKKNRYTFNRDRSFYVTDSEYVLSVFKEQEDAKYSGWKVSDFMNEMRNDTTINTYTKTSENKDMK